MSKSKFERTALRVECTGIVGAFEALSGDEVASACYFCDHFALLLTSARPRVCRSFGTLMLLIDIFASCFRFFAKDEGLPVRDCRFLLAVWLCSYSAGSWG